MVNIPSDLSKCFVFFDFDNTITDFDVLDDIIGRFSINEEWMAWEQAWQQGKIGSRECLSKQLRSVRVSKKSMCRYLDGVKADKSFVPLVNFLKKKGAKIAILSDSFSFLIRRILDNNSSPRIDLYSNRVRFYKDRFIPLFPYSNKECGQCGNCKKLHMYNYDGKPGTVKVYVGDGLSDICAAEHCDIVFAKDDLLEHLTKKNMACIPFKNLGEVFREFSGGRT